MLRRLFRVLSALSLLLCVAVCVLWVRSYRRLDVAILLSGDAERVPAGPDTMPGEQGVSGRTGGLLEFDSGGGEAAATFFRFGFSERTELSCPAPHPIWSRRSPAVMRRQIEPPDGKGLRAAGLIAWHQSSVGGELWTIVVPYRVLALVSALLPLLWLGAYGRRAWVRRRRKGLGLCLRCGYDLRESPGRCPECGTAGAGAGQSAV